VNNVGVTSFALTSSGKLPIAAWEREPEWYAERLVLTQVGTPDPAPEWAIGLL
jgi:hypothetical protein